MRESPFDAVYFYAFLASAWIASGCIYLHDWVDLLPVAVPFVGWTLLREP